VSVALPLRWGLLQHPAWSLTHPGFLVWLLARVLNEWWSCFSCVCWAWARRRGVMSYWVLRVNARAQLLCEQRLHSFAADRVLWNMLAEHARLGTLFPLLQRIPLGVQCASVSAGVCASCSLCCIGHVFVLRAPTHFPARQVEGAACHALVAGAASGLLQAGFCAWMMPVAACWARLSA
jgi:hypothetical protein